MAHPVEWPGKYFFYPIGNTSAVCLTRDLAPEDPANILLLGCGDPRHVLYTIFCEPRNVDRKLDFTCCDKDPAILARNVLLFAMIIDKRSHTTVIWNIFFHMYLDKESHSVLVQQCKKLIKSSDNIQHWKNSPYGKFVKMSTDYTLAEIRRHWVLYVDMQDLPRARTKALEDAFSQQFKATSEKIGTVLSTARSAGPLLFKAVQVSSELLKRYWATGVTSGGSDSGSKKSAGKLLNPTLVYSLGGEGTSFHYATDPFASFHFAGLFGNSKGSVTGTDIVQAAKAEFNEWCTAFDRAVSSATSKAPPVIRLFLGEATAVCRALYAFASTGTTDLGIPISQWKTQCISLSQDEYTSGGAPAYFDVIETSNLIDHIGLLNILIATVPLISITTQSSVLYTESLLFLRGQDATKEFADLLHADITAVGLLIDLCPVDYLSGFTTRSNTHELMMHQSLKGNTTQFHQVTTWKSPMSGDAAAIRGGGGRIPPVFDSRQLGTLLYDMYHRLFEQEDSMHFWEKNRENLPRAVASSNIVHYMREGFVLFLKLVRARLAVPQHCWFEVMVRFFDIEDADTTLKMDTVNLHDFCAQLHRHGVYTLPEYQHTLPKFGRFLHWETIPPLVRIVLVIPHENLAALEDAAQRLATPLLQCDVRGNFSHNLFSAIHLAFGRVIPMGTRARPRVLFEEDPKGKEGTSSLVASFAMPAWLLTDVEPMEKLSVRLLIRSTTASAILITKLGLELVIFSAKLLDESHVHVMPEHPLPSKDPHVPPPNTSGLLAQIGVSNAASVELDEQCELVNTLSVRVSVEDGEVKQLFSSGATPHILHPSPCVMRLTIGGRSQDIVYPFPVIGSQNKLRLAGKSLYIEVVVPVSGPFKSDGMKLNPFSIVGAGRNFRPWSIHRVNLSTLPVLNIKAEKVDEWLNPHVGSMMSARERSLRKNHGNDPLTFIKDTLHSIFVRSAGIQGGPAQRVFALHEKSTRNCDTVFFVSDLRFDLHSHTMICDGYVLPLTEGLILKIHDRFAKVVGRETMVNVDVLEGEMKAWKQILPASVERCRSSWHHGENCEYLSQGKIPLAETMELDPLCSCGRGKDVEAMEKVALWRNLAPYVTRVALSPLFGVSYLEAIGRDPEAHKCSVCRGKGKPKMMKCTACKVTRYCSQACQKKDWKAHKTRCKLL